jgi:methionyl-tRNA formyltransferase
VINGEKETGVTTFKLQHEIDTGNILLQKSFPIGDDETAGEVHDTMKIIGAQLLVKTVEGLANGSLKEIPQKSTGNEQIKHAPKIFTETCKIDWNKPAAEIYNLIRGLSPYPAAFTYLNDKMLKTYKAKKVLSSSPDKPGTIETDKKSYLQFACADGYIQVTELQLEGKKKMPVEEFLKGYRF